MKPCDNGPYIYDSGNHSAGHELNLALGVGSAFQFKKASLVYASAAGIGWVGELFNWLDGTDYADFFGLSDSSCDGASLRRHLARGTLSALPVRKSYVPELLRACRQVEACGPFGNRSRSLVATAALPGVLRRLFAAGPSETARSVLVFRFDMSRSYRELLNYCIFDEAMRRRFRAARERRRRVVKGVDEQWIAVHFRWGDVRTASMDAPNWRTVGLSQLLRAATTVQRSLAAASGGGGGGGGRPPRVDFYSEGNASEFAAVRQRLPEAALHLESGPQPTRDSLDRMSRADVLIGGGGVTSSFFVLAAHLCDACVVVTTHSPKFFPTTSQRPPHHRLVALPLVAGEPRRASAAFSRAWEGLAGDRSAPRRARRCDGSQPLPRFGADVLGAIPPWNKKQVCGREGCR
eukprot:Transcript_22710.p1 GENE.Transcript_22710~~Transcript_22710.p1  ORF type:complete len:406 (-),score=127.45 Transcript_22710:59-1276(-)